MIMAMLSHYKPSYHCEINMRGTFVFKWTIFAKRMSCVNCVKTNVNTPV